MSYLEFNNEKLIDEVEKETGSTYEKKGKFILLDNIEPMVEDLLKEIHSLQEELEDVKEQMDNYYRPLTHKELGVE